MTKTLTNLALGAAAVGLAACADTPPSQRNAAIGAGVGALAGAAVAGDNTTGALLGGAAGAALGYYTGCRQEGGCFVGGRQVEGDLQYDSRADRYFYRDDQTGRTYWENGDPRS
jgi:hypothetical protein